jgi:hypothetical protein
MDQLLFALALFGSWYILGASVITLRIRQRLYNTRFKPAMLLVEMLGCPSCYAFWAGLLFGVLWPEQTLVLVKGNPFAAQPAVLGAIATGLNTLLARATGFMASPSVPVYELRVIAPAPPKGATE